MRTVTITLDHNPELESREAHDLECYAAVNGKQYHTNLMNICNILANYDKGKNKKTLTPEAKEVLDDIRKLCAPNFKGLYHETK